MIKAFAVLILLSIILTCPVSARSEILTVSNDFSNMFNEHGAVMLVINPQDGAILYANNAALSFYGYSREELLSMKISQINTLTTEDIQKEMAAAVSEQRNYFIFKHKLKSEEIRSVEVFSYPVRYEGREVLYSIIHDISEKVLLEQKEERMIIVANNYRSYYYSNITGITNTAGKES
ncbi:MAG TPA: PAS domain S-box protein [Clostridiaceae bacterium]|nr:PAS domain S-box protein [Clostridiaceae bacterium]